MDRCRILLLLCALLPLTAAADDKSRAQAELTAVRERIEALQTELRDTDRRRSRAERELQKVEKAEQTARRELQKLRQQKTAAQRREADLRAEVNVQQQALTAQQQALAQQLKVAYINGDEGWLRVVLSQQDPAALGRRMTYYGYLSRQRAAAIETLRAAMEVLAATRADLQAELQRLARLEAAAADTLQDIANKRAERAKVVGQLQKAMASNDAELAELKAQASELSELIAKLAKRLPAMPATNAEPFAGQTASLQWPADGPLLKRFGEARADGSLKWNGVLLGAPAGSEVRAVYHGRVVFADWLAGMGLLTIIEHDGGYMSLYGHNQDLTRAVGDWVDPGETIAHVGDSGGQTNAGLYFEIRKDGEPVNPQNWVR